MESPSSWIELGRRGAFTTSQVGRLIGVDPRKVASWIDGRPPLIVADFDRIAGRIALSFDALVEARAVAYLLAEGVSSRRLRSLMKTLRKRHGDQHPLARERALVTDGATTYEMDDGKFINLLNDCYASEEIIRPSLAGRVVFKGGRAAWLEPYPAELPLVRIDPQRAFGRPVVVDGRVAVPTETLTKAAETEGVEEAGDWFGVSVDAVEQAVTFEERLAA